MTSGPPCPMNRSALPGYPPYLTTAVIRALQGAVWRVNDNDFSGLKRAVSAESRERISVLICVPRHDLDPSFLPNLLCKFIADATHFTAHQHDCQGRETVQIAHLVD